MAEPAKMPEGLKRLPEEYQKANDGIERLFKLVSQSDSANKKQASDLAKEYRTEIRNIIKEQDKTQKEVAFYISELRKAGANDQEIAAYLKKNIRLKSGEEQLSASMKKMQENLQGMVQNVKFKTDEDRVLAEKQSQTLEKYFKQREKTKAEKWANRKLNTVKEETGTALKESLAKGLGAGFQTLLGPLRLIVDPILDLGGTKSLDLFDKIISKSGETEAAKDEAALSRFDGLADTYSEEDEWKKNKRKTPKGRKGENDDPEAFLKKLTGEPSPGKTGKEKEGTDFRGIPGIPDFLPDRKTEEPDAEKPDRPEGKSNILEVSPFPNFLGEGEEKPEESSGGMAGILARIEPARSDLLKRGGVIGASAVFLADSFAGKEMPEKPGEGKNDTDFPGFAGIRNPSDEGGRIEKLAGDWESNIINFPAPPPAVEGGVEDNRQAVSIGPARSGLLKRGGVIGAPADFPGGESPLEKPENEKIGTNLLDTPLILDFPDRREETSENIKNKYFGDVPPLLSFPIREKEGPGESFENITENPAHFKPAQSGLPIPPKHDENFLDVPPLLESLNRGKEKPEESSGGMAGILARIEPARSDLLKRGGVIGASAVFLADFLTGEPSPEKSGKEKGGTNFLGIPGGIGGLKGAIAKFLPAAVGNAVAVSIPLAMAAGAAILQKRDTEDTKKYAGRGEYGRAAETFLLGDRERITEETAGGELARAAGKAALAGGAAAAAGAATAAGAGTLGAAGAAGAAALGAVVPPVLIAAAIAAAAAAVAKGTQEAYELEYDKNAAVIQRDLQRLISGEEAPFLKRVGASFKSEWIEFTSALAGGIRGVTEVMDVEAERNVQQQLEILRKQAEDSNEESARLYEMMSRQSFREMTAKEKERLLRSEGLYEEYITVVAESENSFWEKLKNGTKAVVKGAESALNTAHENMRGGITAEWEQLQLHDMDKKLSRKEDTDRLRNSEVYQDTLGETGDPLKAMQEAFLAERREMAQARGDMDANGMAVDMFDRIKLRLKSFADISDEAIRQSTEFDTRRLRLLAEGMSAEEADRKAMEEQRDLLNSQTELRLKQTKEYKKAFEDALKEGKSLKDAEKQALNKVKGNKEYLKSFGQSLSEGLRDMWQSARDFFGTGWGNLKNGGTAALENVKDFGSNVWNAVTGSGGPGDIPAINDGIVYKDGKVVKIADDDNIIATKSEPLIGDSETNKAAAVPVAPVINEFSDVNIVSVLGQILTALKEKEFSPVINTGGDSGMNFDSLRTAGAV